MDDGFSTVLSFANLPDIKMYERELVLPALKGGGGKDTTNMRQLAHRSQTEDILRSVSSFTVTAAFATDAFADAKLQLGINQLISLIFPDGLQMQFYGWMEEFTPQKFVEGELALVAITVHASLRNLQGVETPPTYSTDILGPVSLALSLTQQGTWDPEVNVLNFSIVVTNGSSQYDAENLVVVLDLPVSFTVTSSDSLTYALLAAGQSATINFTVTPEIAPGTFSLSAEATADNPGALASDTLDVDLTILCGFEVTPSKVTGTVNAGILWRARDQTNASVISVEMVNNGVSTPLLVTVVGNAITVQLAVSSGASITSTANQVIAAVQAHAEANALIHVELPRFSNGTSVVSVASVFFMLEEGGGNPFECYPDGVITDTSIPTGTGFTSIVIGDGP